MCVYSAVDFSLEPLRVLSSIVRDLCLNGGVEAIYIDHSIYSDPRGLHYIYVSRVSIMHTSGVAILYSSLSSTWY